MTDDAMSGRRSPTPRPAVPPVRKMAPNSLDYSGAPIDPETKARWAARSAPHATPIATFAIAIGLWVVFAAEYLFNVGPVRGLAPGGNSLIALGAISRHLVFGANEPWRVVTAVLLHANLAHIIGNTIVLCLAGITLERLVGWAWLGATFVVSGLAGSAAVLICDPANQFGVGASGAIMGVLSAAFVCSFHPRAAALRRTVQFACARVAIPALIPFSSIEGGPNIDYNAHGGGCLAGLVIGLLMLQLWRDDEPLPAQRSAAAGLAWSGLAIAAISFGLVAWRYPAYAQTGEPFAPEIPAVTAKSVKDPAFAARTAELVRDYPHDPRVHLIRSAYLLSTNDPTGAEGEARAGLAEQEAITHDFPGAGVRLRLLLALILLGEGRTSEAQAQADPWCYTEFQELDLAELRGQLISGGLCGGFEADKRAYEGN
jgi:rhomboid protease GluP